MHILNRYEIDNVLFTEYTSDGVNVSHISESSISQTGIEDIEIIEEPSELEMILFETQYQTTLLEIGGMI